MTRAALIHNNVVVNIITLDRESCEADLKRYEAEKKCYDEQCKNHAVLEKKLESVNKRLANYKYKRDFVITDKQEFDKKHGRTVKGLLAERTNLGKLTFKHPKVPRPPKGHYEPPKDHILVELEKGQQCNIGWVYKDGGFDDPSTPEPEHKKPSLIKRILGGKNA